MTLQDLKIQVHNKYKDEEWYLGCVLDPDDQRILVKCVLYAIVPDGYKEGQFKVGFCWIF